MSKINSVIKNHTYNLNPTFVLITFGLIMGLLLCVFIPYGAGFDEEQHTIRIFDISGLHLIPNRPASQGNYSPSGFFSLAYSNQFFRSPGFYQFDKDYFYSKIDWQNMVSGITNATYFPLIYFPQAVVAGLAWRVFNFPIIPVIIVMRLVGFLLYLLACYLTIRILPIGKWLFLVLALSPSVLFQASTLSADGFTNAVSFLFIGVVLQAFWNKDKSISMLDGWKLFAASLLLGAAKPGTIILLPIIIILFLRKVESKKVTELIVSGAILSVIISIGWTVLFTSNSSHGLNNSTTQKTFSEQIILILQNLNDFIPMYLKGIILSFNQIYQDIVGGYSYWGRSFYLIYILFPFALFSAFLSEVKNNKPKIKERIFLFLVSFICVFLIGSVIYITEYIPNQQSYGSQGRYLLPFIPLLFISWAAFYDPKKWLKQCGSIITILLIAMINGFYLIGFYRIFYSNCLDVFNTGNSCKLPIYQNLDVNSPFSVKINSKNIIDQSFQPKCSAISDIEIRALPKFTNKNGIVRLSVLDKDSQLIRTSDVPIISVNSKEQTSFPFTAIRVNKNDKLHFTISLVNSQSSEMVLDVMGIKDDFYKDGALSMNGKSMEEASDLVFQYTCIP